MGFSPEAVATFIAVVGVLSVAAQTAILGRYYLFFFKSLFFFIRTVPVVVYFYLINQSINIL